MIQHRSDIDGLRAVAVGLVVLFHLGLPVPGGFIGVDVFFVISGYLITSILHADLERGRYSLLEFYNRRARRILPALLVMLLVSSLVGLALLLPSALRNYGLSLISTGLFASNLFFWFDTGYFASAAESRPLLHTWSLAVEEQFYLLFPLLLAALHRRAPRALRLSLAGLALGSLLYSEWLLRHTPESAFYLLPSRAWELLLGSLLALGTIPRIRSAPLRQVLGLSGLAAIAYGAWAYSEATRFPGLSALAPCLGAALLIHSGGHGDTLAARLLSLPPVRFVGLISYSLYLWHWPVIVFYREGLLGEYGAPQRLGLLLISLALATLSWRYVETPFRQLDHRRWPAARLLRAAAVGLVAAGVAGGLLAMNGFPQRFQPTAQEAAAWLDYQPGAQFRSGRCFLSSNQKGLADYDRDLCLKEAVDRPTVLLVGDSHAAHLWEGLSRQLSGLNVQQATASGCMPLTPITGAHRCAELIRYIFERHLPSHRPSAILLSARWREQDLGRLVETAKWLQQFSPRVIVLGPIQEYRLPLPQLLAYSLERDAPGLANGLLSRQRFDYDRQMGARLRAEGLTYLSAIEQTCPQQHCRTQTPEGEPLQFDYGHLTGAGAYWLAGRWKDSGALDF